MAFTQSNIKRESVGSMWALSGEFTSASGDNSLSITHGFYHVADARVSLQAGALNTLPPKITHSGGAATVTFDDTRGKSGTFYIVGK